MGIFGLGVFASQQPSELLSEISESSEHSTEFDVEEIKDEVVEEVIPFELATTEDRSLARGQTRISQRGIPGKLTVYYAVTYKNGQEVSREELRREVIEPVKEITSIGTYVAPVVQHPPGATAICKDGAYSYSQNRRGTCSWHGGVARWL